LAILLRFAKGSGFEGEFSEHKTDYQIVDFNNQLGAFQHPPKKLALANLRRIAKA
jgi:hypothetical protein